jgi:protease I
MHMAHIDFTGGRIMKLSEKKVVMLVERDFEDLELWYPVLRLREDNVKVLIAGKVKGQTYKGKYGLPIQADIDFKEMLEIEFDGLLVPGGWAPDMLRREPEVLEFTKRMDQENKPIGHICHAGWVLVSADVLRGKTVTSTPGIKDDMINAGATWVDEACVVDQNIVSSRRPADLPPFVVEFIRLLEAR